MNIFSTRNFKEFTLDNGESMLIDPKNILYAYYREETETLRLMLNIAEDMLPREGANLALVKMTKDSYRKFAEQLLGYNTMPTISTFPAQQSAYGVNIPPDEKC